MRDKISYEWVCEELDEDGDIIDPLFSDTLVEALRDKERSDYPCDLALVRYEGNEEDGLKVREYAYTKDGKLPVEFDDGYRIPKCFHKELER